MLLRCLESGVYLPCDGSSAPTPLTAVDVASLLRSQRVQGNLPELHLLLPAQRCLVLDLPVAKHEAKHLSATLPWTLEERLLEPVEQVHVAHGPVQDGSAPVSAINAAWLQHRVDDLRAAGLQPQSACSELLLLPWQEGQWSVAFADADMVLVRHGAHAGFACARRNLNTALQLLLNEQQQAPQQVRVIGVDANALDATLFPVLLQSRLSVQRHDAQRLAAAFAPPACNLLQGAFAPALPWAKWWREWRVAAVLLFGLLLGDLALSAYGTVQLERAAAEQDAAIVALYRSVQPDGALVDPRLQLEQAIAAAGASGNDSFLELLSRMAPALQATPEARVQNLEYDASNGLLQLQVLTADYAAAEKLRGYLQNAGLQAELLGSSRDGSGNRTRLRVGGGA